MKEFPILDEPARLTKLQPPAHPVRVVLDTDTYNEIDDQYALVHALLSPEQIQLEAIYAAPFHNARSEGPGDGMEKSYDEIVRLLEALPDVPRSPVFRGATRYLTGALEPVASETVTDLVQRAIGTPEDNPLYVVAIGAATNVASAILTDPAIIKHIVVVWLGGHGLHWPHTREFNLMQDVNAARLLFDCGVPLVHVPCQGVTSHLLTTEAEIARFVRGRGAIGDYLADILGEYRMSREEGDMAWSKIIWDMATIAYLINPEWVQTKVIHSPVLTDQLTWSVDQGRHFVRSAWRVDRDSVFGDLFSKLAGSG